MKTVRNFMWYMYNKWNRQEAIYVFGENLGNHLYNKWMRYYENVRDYNLTFFAEIDNECRTKIVQRANEIYGE